jgi:hypothetical protein
MIRLWLSTPATLARHWRKLSGDCGLLFLQSHSSLPGFPRTVKPRDNSGKLEVLQWPRLCLELLKEAGIPTGKLLQQQQIDEVIRAALRDDRCASIAAYQGIQRRPGQVSRLSDRLKRTTAQDYADSEALPWFADPALETLRSVYQEKLAESGGIDAPGLFLRFLNESQSKPLQAAIEHWHENLAERFGGTYALVVPSAERLLEEKLKFERAISLILFDRFPEVHLGSYAWPDDSAERIQNITEDWLTIGAELNPIEPVSDVPEYWFIDSIETAEKDAILASGRLRFVTMKDAREEIEVVTEYVRGLTEAGIQLGDIEIRTPLQGDYVDHLREALEDAGILVRSQPGRLVDCPRTRAALDVAGAIAADWPVEALADLLRHPNFRREAFVAEVSAVELARLALNVERLGNLNGIELIRRMLLVREEEKEARRRTGQKSIGESLIAVEALSNLESALPVPIATASWNRRVNELKRDLHSLFDDAFFADGSIVRLFEALENGVGAAVDGNEAGWTWADFLSEVQLRAESSQWNRSKEESSAVRLESGSAETHGNADYSILTGMTEGHYPSRTKIRDALMRSGTVDLKELRASELRTFRELVGSARESLWVSYHRRDDSGLELEPAGFLREIEWSVPDNTISKKTISRDELEPGIANTIDAARKRLSSRGGIYDGEFANPLALRQLADRFGPDYAFSASSLEAASLCRFRFFGVYVLGLGEGEIDDDLATDYRAEGETVHKVLEDLHRGLPIDELTDLNVEAIEARLTGLVAERHPCPPRLASSDLGRARWEVQNKRIVSKLAHYAIQIRRDLEPPSGRGKNRSNAASLFEGQFEVLQCELRAGPGSASLTGLTIQADEFGPGFRIGGRIDRIDGDADGDVRRVRLIDYKTGRPITEKELKSKLHLQLPVYAMMVHQSRFGGDIYHIEDLGFWYLKSAKGGYSSIRDWISPDGPLDVDLLRIEYVPYLQSLVSGIRAGKFAVRPQILDCVDKCDLAELCRIRERRARGRTASSTSDFALISQEKN